VAESPYTCNSCGTALYRQWLNGLTGEYECRRCGAVTPEAAVGAVAIRKAVEAGQQTLVRSYRGESEEDVYADYDVDAARMAGAGFHPIRQEWDAETVPATDVLVEAALSLLPLGGEPEHVLTVTYQAGPSDDLAPDPAWAVERARLVASRWSKVGGTAFVIGVVVAWFLAWPELLVVLVITGAATGALLAVEPGPGLFNLETRFMIIAPAVLAMFLAFNTPSVRDAGDWVLYAGGAFLAVGLPMWAGYLVTRRLLPLIGTRRESDPLP
jgi:hypothetical protein